jgi:hypothetical protein
MGGQHHVPAATPMCLGTEGWKGLGGPSGRIRKTSHTSGFEPRTITVPKELSRPLRITLYRNKLVRRDTRRTRLTPAIVHPSLLTDKADSCDNCGAYSGGDVGYDNVWTGKQFPTFRSCCHQLQDVYPFYPSWTKETVTPFETSVNIYQ